MTAQETSQSLELSINRYIEAAPERVWTLIRDHMAEWWCPRPWWVELVEQQWHAGGRSATVMHGPSGERFENEGIFLEVTEGRRIVFTDAFASDWQPQQPFMVGIIEIAAEGGGTRYTGSARHWSEQARQQHREMGFAQGWSAVADQVAALAERTSFTRRVINASPAAVYAAIADPARLARWWGPNGFSCTFDSCEFREGGDWRLTMHGPDGTRYPNHNRFIEIADSRRVVIEHIDETHPFTLAISLTADGDRTTVGWYQQFDSIDHYRAIADFVGHMNEQVLDRLTGEVTGA